MKTIIKLILSVTFCIVSTGLAMGAPTFDIDFYGGDTGLVQGDYDTGTNLSLSDGQSVSVDILISGLDEGNGLAGWALRLDYGEGIEASNLDKNSDLWPMSFRQPEILDGYLTIEGLAAPGAGVEGDDLLLFSFDLTSIDSSIVSMLTLWDYDMGGRLDDVQTLLGDTLDGNQLPVDLAMANVPIPAAVWMFGSGIVGLMALRRKSQRK